MPHFTVTSVDDPRLAVQADALPIEEALYLGTIDIAADGENPGSGVGDAAQQRLSDFAAPEVGQVSGEQHEIDSLEVGQLERSHGGPMNVDQPEDLERSPVVTGH